MEKESKIMKPKTKQNNTSHTPKLMLVKTIADFCGKDERRIMFRKVKNKLYMFVINSKTMGKVTLSEKPKTYPMKDFENLGAFLYKLNREKAK